MLAAEIKKRMFAAMKAKAIVEKEILRVALGEITMEDARGNSSDAVTEGILKKLVKSNRETLASSTDAEQKAVLEQEIQILEEFLPKSLGVDAILAALAPVADAIKAAKADGPATGIAMKHLKQSDAVVEGRDVGEAVKRLRS